MFSTMVLLSGAHVVWGGEFPGSYGVIFSNLIRYSGEFIAPETERLVSLIQSTPLSLKNLPINVTN
jgi:hypothetical protein